MTPDYDTGKREEHGNTESCRPVKTYPAPSSLRGSLCFYLVVFRVWGVLLFSWWGLLESASSLRNVAVIAVRDIALPVYSWERVSIAVNIVAYSAHWGKMLRVNIVVLVFFVFFFVKFFLINKLVVVVCRCLGSSSPLRSRSPWIGKERRVFRV